MRPRITQEQLKNWGYQTYLSTENALTDMPDYRYTLYYRDSVNDWAVWISHPHGNGELVTLPPKIKENHEVSVFLEEQNNILDDGLSECQSLAFPDLLLNSIIEQSKHQHWQCVTLENHQINGYNPSDFSVCNYCVHVEKIPFSPLKIDKEYPITVPILSTDGVIYDSSSFIATYSKRYIQALYSRKPLKGGYERLLALYHEENTWKVFIIHEIGSKEEIVLSNNLPLLSNLIIKNFLSEQLEKIEDSDNEEGILEDDGKIESVEFPQELIDYLFSVCNLPIDKGLLTTKKSIITGEIFSPHQYRSIQFACKNSFQSKLSPDKWFDDSCPLVGIFHSENHEDDAVMMIEKTEPHGVGYHCALIDVYQFKSGNKEINESARIRHRSFRGLQYALLTQVNLLGIYHLTPADCRGRVHLIKLEKLTELEKEIREKQKKIESQMIRYAYRSGKASFNFLSFISRVEYHNAATLFVAVLISSGIFRQGHLDPRFRIVTEPNWKMRLVGATPRQVLPPVDADRQSVSDPASHL